jgi:hypothetical protein
MKRLPVFLLTFVLAACASVGPPAPSPVPVLDVTAIPTDDPTLLPALFPNAEGNSELSRIDEQGAVIVEVTPLNLDTPADTLEFDVTMNTHSVDLSMDLAALATLSTDTGVMVQAAKWDASPGGHHVSGTLIFPALQDGKSILAGANKLSLTLVNIDAPSRAFEWELQ